MIQTLKKIEKLISSLVNFIPAVIQLLEDLADDGKLNRSNRQNTGIGANGDSAPKS